MSRQVYDIAIVGAGMVGAAFALALAREGFEVALIETRAPAPWRAEDEVDLRVVALAASSIANHASTGLPGELVGSIRRRVGGHHDLELVDLRACGVANRPAAGSRTLRLRPNCSTA